MQLTTDATVIQDWAPLVMEGREPGPVAATMGDWHGGQLRSARARLCGWLALQEHCGVATGWKVTRLRRGDGQWQLGLRCVATGEVREQRARFVFVGAGGGSLPLLQSTGLAEVAGLGGFPIGGQWLVCDEPSICAAPKRSTPPRPQLGLRAPRRRRLMAEAVLLAHSPRGPPAFSSTRKLD